VASLGGGGCLQCRPHRLQHIFRLLPQIPAENFNVKFTFLVILFLPEIPRFEPKIPVDGSEGLENAGAICDREMNFYALYFVFCYLHYRNNTLFW